MRPPGYEPGELPTAPLRDVVFLFCDCKGTTFLGIVQVFGEKKREKCCNVYQKPPVRAYFLNISLLIGASFPIFPYLCNHYETDTNQPVAFCLAYISFWGGADGKSTRQPDRKTLPDGQGYVLFSKNARTAHGQWSGI